MTDQGTLQVLVVANDPTVSELLEETSGVTAITRCPDEVLPTLATLGPDCLLVTGPDCLDAATVDAVESRRIPVVAYTDAAIEALATREWIAGYVRSDHSAGDDRRRLLDELVWVTSQETRQQLRHSTDRVTSLHDAAVRLFGAETAEALYQSTVAVADDVLEFDICYVGIVDGEYIVPKAVSTAASADDARTMHVDEGLAGKTYRTGESQLVRRIDADDDASPTRPEYRSGISVAIGDDGVFQAVARRESWFDESDLELAELLVSHVTATLKRIEAESRLRSERDRLCALFENVPDAAIAFEFDDGRPIVQRVNTAFERVFGYAAEEVVGENIDEFVVPPEHDVEATAFNEKLQAGRNLRTEVRRTTATGSRDFLLHVVPIRLDRTNAGGYAIYTDVTEQKERERELRRQNERLDEFASIVSHDLRNPLTVASGYLDLARETTDGDDPHLAKVDTALDRMERLVEGLLRLARNGQVVGETTAVDLRAVATEAWSHVETADVELVTALDGETVDADHDRLVDRLQNLFRNSVEHGAVTTVRIEATDRGFAVTDDGHGIPESDRESVFETGYTTDDDGTGFGLAIVRRIAEAHGWTVTVTEGADGGARFEFSV